MTLQLLQLLQLGLIVVVVDFGGCANGHHNAAVGDRRLVCADN